MTRQVPSVNRRIYNIRHIIFSYIQKLLHVRRNVAALQIQRLFTQQAGLESLCINISQYTIITIHNLHYWEWCMYDVGLLSVTNNTYIPS